MRFDNDIKAEELVSLLAKHQGEDFKMETVSNPKRVKLRQNANTSKDCI